MKRVPFLRPSRRRATSAFRKQLHLLTYGQPIGFSGPVDGAVGSPQAASTSQTVVLYLGNFYSTELVDVQFVLGTETMIENRCCQKPTVDNVKGEIFCSGSVASFNFQSGATPVFYIQ